MEYAVPWTGRCSSGSVLPSIQVEAVSCTAIHLQGSVPSSEADVRCVRWESFETNVAYGGTQKAMEFLASHLSPPPAKFTTGPRHPHYHQAFKACFLVREIDQTGECEAVQTFHSPNILVAPPPPPGSHHARILSPP